MVTTTDHDARPDVAVRPPMTRDEARKATTALRNALVRADNLLVEVHDRGAAEALGYGSGLKGWKAYCEKELPALRMLRITKVERDERLRQHRAQGMSEAALAAAFGVGAGTVHRAVAGVEVEGPLRSLDGKNRSAVAAPRTVVEAPPAKVWPPAYPSYQRVADVVATAGAAGMNYREVANAIPWRDSQTSTALSKAGKRGLVTRTGSRDGCTVWVDAKLQVSGE